MVNFCDLSESSKAVVCDARRACIVLFCAETNETRARHRGRESNPAVDLSALRADRDAKVALALQTGLSLDQIEGGRSHND